MSSENPMNLNLDSYNKQNQKIFQTGIDVDVP